MAADHLRMLRNMAHRSRLQVSSVCVMEIERQRERQRETERETSVCCGTWLTARVSRSLSLSLSLSVSGSLSLSLSFSVAGSLSLCLSMCRPCLVVKVQVPFRKSHVRRRPCLVVEVEIHGGNVGFDPQQPRGLRF